MIQRKQSVFLLLAAIAALVCLMMPVGVFSPERLGVDSVMYNLFVKDGNGVADNMSAPLFVVMFAGMALSVATIFLYGNRKLQIKLCSWNIFLVVVWYAAYAAVAFTFSGSAGCSFKPQFGAVLPLVVLVLVVMARNGVKADEALIRAADRIR